MRKKAGLLRKIGLFYFHRLSFSNTIESGMTEQSLVDDPLQTYLWCVSQVPRFDREQELACMEQVLARDEGSEKARTSLMEGYLHLVVSMTQRYVMEPGDMLDMIQSGNDGLIEAIDNLTDASIHFGAYAAPFIERALMPHVSPLLSAARG